MNPEGRKCFLTVGAFEWGGPPQGGFTVANLTPLWIAGHQFRFF